MEITFVRSCIAHRSDPTSLWMRCDVEVQIEDLDYERRLADMRFLSLERVRLRSSTGD